MNTAERLRQWADARERRNGPDGHGKTGTLLLREAADELEGKPRELPKIDIDILLHGKTKETARAYVDANDLALWISAVLSDAPAPEQWVLGIVRDELLDAAKTRS